MVAAQRNTSLGKSSLFLLLALFEIFVFKSSEATSCVDHNQVEILDCECHPSCLTCGFLEENTYRNPTGQYDCLTCSDGSDPHNGFVSNARHCGTPCPLCYDGATPENPNATTNLDFLIGESTCDTYYRENIGYCTNCEAGSDLACTLAQAKAYYDCGCPTVPPAAPENGCTLCADGSIPENSNALLTGGRFGDNRTCGDLYKTFPVNLGESAYDCAAHQYEAFIQCGCPTKPQKLTAQDQPCTLCEDGSMPLDPNAEFRSPRSWLFSTTCGEAYETAQVINISNVCDGILIDGYTQCGCPRPFLIGSPTPAISTGIRNKAPQATMICVSVACLASFVMLSIGL
jgi:hypothetical protein